MAGSGLEELVKSLKSALENAEASLRREQSLENDIEKKKRENELLQVKLEIEREFKVEKEFGGLEEFQSKIEISTKLKVENQFRDLKDLNSILSEENDLFQKQFRDLKDLNSILMEENDLLQKQFGDLKESASRLREENELLEGKLKIEIRERIEVEKELKGLKDSAASRLREEKELMQRKLDIEVSKRLKAEKEFGDLKEVAARLREERDGLCKRLKEKVGDQNEITELKRKICELECAKLKAKTDTDVYQNRIKELEGEVLIMNVEKDVTTPPDQTNSGKRKVMDDFGENANPTEGSSQRKRRAEILPKDRIDDVLRSNSGFATRGGKSKGDTKSSNLPVNKKTPSKFPSWKTGKASNRTNKAPIKPKKPATTFEVNDDGVSSTYEDERIVRVFIDSYYDDQSITK